ncbi:MAG: dipeptidase [Acidobacteriota bacterium]
MKLFRLFWNIRGRLPVFILLGIFVLSGSKFLMTNVNSSFSSKDSDRVINSDILGNSCTTVIVGKDASVDGSVLTTHTADCHVCDFRLIYVPAKDHKPNEMRPVFRFKKEYPRIVSEERSLDYAPCKGQKPEIIGYIPEIEHTYAYFDAVYGVMNECQLAIGESTAAAKTRAKPKPEGHALFDVAELTRVALERCETARKAIKLMGKLAVEYGYYGWGENLTVIDPDEAWVFEILATPDGKSAIWVAQKVPDDEVAVLPNIFTIREINPDSPDFMFSDNIFSVAEEQGWWNSGTPFDFLKVYSPGEYVHSYYALRRKWRAYDLLAPSKKFDPWVKDVYTKEYPFSVKPDEKISVQDLFRIHRDYYEGTEFDLTKGFAAGPFGTPNRYAGGRGEHLLPGAWERAISIFRCSYSFVIQARNWLPDHIGGVVWWGPDAPHTTCYVPFYAGMTDLPEEYSIGSLYKFTRKSAWWAFDFVSNWADLKFSYMIEDIKAKQKKIENKEFAMQPAIDQAAQMMYKTNSDLAREYLTSYCIKNANDVVTEWWELSDYLITKYNDGYINLPELGKGVGYPFWWLKAVGYDKGPTQYKKSEK